MMKLALTLLSVLLMVGISHGYNHYRFRIPNGEFVVHPCFEANVLWYGVGHKNPFGGGERNQFGQDFADQGFKWTKCLCKMDSDGDGMTNGYELGDPNCNWSEGKEPDRKTSITHPGVCTPMNTTECEGHYEFVTCKDPAAFDCPAIEEPDVKVASLKFPSTSVPKQATTYQCMAFELPTDGDYHLIAATPDIDNDVIMHHIVVYGCNGAEQEYNATTLYSEPAPCGMTECSDYITGWTLGVPGQCFDDHYGLNMGSTGFRWVIVELHWNNPELKSDYFDGSGINLHYTANKRTYDAGNLAIGPSLIMIPPGFTNYDVPASCSADCLDEVFPDTWYIAEVQPHMHYLGTGFKLERIRDGVATTLYEAPQYFYDDPETYKFEEDVEMKKGDALRVTCVYSSKSRDGYTYFGLATSDEMCFAGLIYYPQVPMESTGCIMTNDVGFCPNSITTDYSTICDTEELFQLSETHGISIYTSCDSSGKTCNPRCPNAIEPLLSHPCMKSDASASFMAIFAFYDYRFAQMLASCNEGPVAIAGDDDSASVLICPEESAANAIRIEMGLMLALAILAKWSF